jgi:hypothetical protein
MSPSIGSRGADQEAADRLDERVRNSGADQARIEGDRLERSRAEPPFPGSDGGCRSRILWWRASYPERQLSMWGMGDGSMPSSLRTARSGGVLPPTRRLADHSWRKVPSRLSHRVANRNPSRPGGPICGESQDASPTSPPPNRGKINVSGEAGEAHIALNCDAYESGIDPSKSRAAQSHKPSPRIGGQISRGRMCQSHREKGQFRRRIPSPR